MLGTNIEHVCLLNYNFFKNDISEEFKIRVGGFTEPVFQNTSKIQPHTEQFSVKTKMETGRKILLQPSLSRKIYMGLEKAEEGACWDPCFQEGHRRRGHIMNQDPSWGRRSSTTQ